MQKKKNVVASKDEAAAAKAAEDHPESDDTNAAATKLQAIQRGKQERAAVEAAKAEHGTENGALAGKCAAPEAEAAPAAEEEAAPAGEHVPTTCNMMTACVFCDRNCSLHEHTKLTMHPPFMFRFIFFVSQGGGRRCR